MKTTIFIGIIWLAIASSALAFPRTNDISRCEFYYGHYDPSNITINVDLGEARQFISMFPLFGNLKGWSEGIERKHGEKIDPAPLYYHLLLIMKDGKQKGVSFSLHAGLVSYYNYGLRKVPAELKDKANAQLEKWQAQWMKLQSREKKLESDARIRKMLNG